MSRMQCEVEVGPENSEPVGVGIAPCSMDYRHSNLPEHIGPVLGHKKNARKVESC
jgi:hypothetical protein